MWKRNLLFAVICLSGLGSLLGSLFRPEREWKSDHTFESHKSASWSHTVQLVNNDFEQLWRETGLAPTERAPELTIVRRLSLGLTGTIPSIEELRRLDQVPPAERIDWWVSHLLADRRYADYVAERLARAFVGVENGPFLLYRRRRFTVWLSDQIAENVPYDQIVRKLIADQGLWTDIPAVNFVTATADPNNDSQPDPIRLAGRTTRAFLGMRIDCLQCHDDQLGKVQLGTPLQPREGTQQDFHHLAAFFGQTTNSFFGIRDEAKRSYKYKYLKAEKEETVPPQVPFSPELLPKSGTSRQRLAQWITNANNRPFARVTVNRVWAILFGRPLMTPIDDIPLHGPYPAALETLSSDFVENGFDLRRLIRIIAASDVFHRDSRSLTMEITPEHESQWAAFPLTRLRPEQVAGQIIQAASLKTIDQHSHIVFKLQRFFQERDFVERFGDAGDAEFDERGGTVTQRLQMMNGDLAKGRSEPNPLVNATSRIAGLAPTDELAVETAFLATLTRKPTPRELEHFTARLQGRTGQEREEELEDLYWIIWNGAEFSWNH